MGPGVSKLLPGLTSATEPRSQVKSQKHTPVSHDGLDYEQVVHPTVGELDLQGVRVKQGVHEMEVCLNSPSLRRRRQQALVSRCVKGGENPGHHASFIPITEFSLKHLPARYRSEDVLHFLQLSACLTARLCVAYTSPKRTGPFSVSPSGHGVLRLGTGWAGHTMEDLVRHDVPCPFPKCTESSEPHTVSRPIFVNTAKHVVFDSTEARRTTVEFFYDTAEDMLSQRLMRAQGLYAHTDAARDWCVLECVTHDKELLQQLVKVGQALRILSPSVDMGDNQGQEKDMVIIVSHPHGSFKHVSIGQCQAVEIKGKQLEEGSSRFEEECRPQQVRENKRGQEVEKDHSFPETRPDECEGLTSSRSPRAGHEADHRKATGDTVEEIQMISEESETEEEPGDTSTRGMSASDGGESGDTIQPDPSGRREWCSYRYTTPTCAGSSGAPVWVAGTSGALYYLTPHCERDGRSGEGLLIQTTGDSTEGKARIQK